MAQHHGIDARELAEREGARVRGARPKMSEGGQRCENTGVAENASPRDG